ncbi:isopentenyl-diphosphate delta-isomerase [Lentzea guizhouensis]|uniref:Isopentenyl-diphosphate Delta-isomerase n=1 Tax=Lentzea guizhouensis TaxID=1586287 RepID=A0A1B2I0V8_9PSEU|nr:isopentenyl-diphosphate Delta-isomerase [Lentzea guizhouensis]ANZ43591.1 isopentenyl-diphosphate delta-isomerase [Lentzea guizhouensis]
MEQVVLLAEDGSAIGVEDKAVVHHADTPLHLAFSSYVFDSAGNTVLTRRALHKKTFPGLWTNTCCGHPLPEEDMAQAVLRRLRDELGMSCAEPELLLPAFRYRAEMDGVVENEMCPVFRVLSDDEPNPNPDEVDSTERVPWTEFAESALNGTRVISPWSRLQIAELVKLGPDPLAWPVADRAGLPEAVVLSPLQ